MSILRCPHCNHILILTAVSEEDNSNDAVLAIILSQVAEEFDCPEADIKGPSRKKELVIARQAYCYLSRQFSEKSGEEIGRMISRDRSTVHTSVTDFEGRMYSDFDLRKKIRDMKLQIMTLVNTPKMKGLSNKLSNGSPIQKAM
jgi:chromosomal replication initiation ATPase DnaA